MRTPQIVSAYRVGLALLLLTSTSVFGQIPNSGFERWIDAGTHLNPEGWWTINDSVASGGYYPVTRSMDHFPTDIGNYSIRLENNIAVFPNWNAMGITWTGDFSGNDNPVFPVPGHPTSLWGYYKFFPQNGDTMEIHIRLYRDFVDVGGGSFKTGETADAWTAFSLNISDYSEADSARIMISSCYDNDEPLPHGNSVLYIDNLNFDHPITTAAATVYANNQITVYPNPASQMLSVSVGNFMKEQLDLNIYSMLGQQVLSWHVSVDTAPIQLDIAGLTGGTYFIQAISDNKVVGYTKVNILR
ncbi:MAG: T9SS type A sorting domain-containing protein [Bacteroidetes bacterium]|nr:MAG: T9SS type A sorting domain-containing protein [Bacteroidota bacterium]